MQRFDEADRPEPAAAAEEIDRREPAAGQDRIDHAVMPEDLLEAECADERRQDHRDHDEKMCEVLPREVVAVVQERERERDEEHEEGRDSRDREAVDEPFAVDVVAEHLGQQPPVESDADHREDRREQESPEERDDGREQQILNQPVAHFIFPPSRAVRLRGS